MTAKFQPPSHGPYARRATLVHDALAPLLQKEFGRDLRFAKRGGDQTLIFVWDLPHRVQVNISKSAGNADPTIWIHRNDPAGHPGPGGDWKNEPIQRDYESQSYDLEAIMGKIRAAVTYNRERSESHSANVKAMVTELEGIPIPKEGVEVVRDEKTGLYTIRHTIHVKGVELEDAKATLRKISQICDATAPKATVGDGKSESPV